MADANLIVVRFGARQWEALCALLFSRYPRFEWATWVRFGWRETADAVVFTMSGIDPPHAGDLDDSVGNVAIQESYSLRIALQAEQHPFAVGLVHSHPRDYLPIASDIDDDMDCYYADYLIGFTSGRPYLSLIIAERDGAIEASGRVWIHGQWQPVTRFVVEGRSLPSWVGRNRLRDRRLDENRIARLSAGFGRVAAQRIRNACIAVVGASGTGSPAIEVLARAGVGHIIVVDPDRIEGSNLERLHGGYLSHVESRASKVAIAKEHVAAIDPDIHFEGLIGRVPQQTVVERLVQADLILGCTDQQHARLALSELAFRYLVPVIDCGVALEGANGHVTGQTIQLVNFESEDACAVCRQMISWERVGQELMPESERKSRQAAAREALARGENPGGYWQDLPQLNTVGYLTTTAGALAAGAALGIVSETFRPGFSRLQLNPLSVPVDALDWAQDHRPDCMCRQLLGWAGLEPEKNWVTPGLDWPPVEIIG